MPSKTVAELLDDLIKEAKYSGEQKLLPVYALHYGPGEHPWDKQDAKIQALRQEILSEVDPSSYYYTILNVLDQYLEPNLRCTTCGGTGEDLRRTIDGDPSGRACDCGMVYASPIRLCNEIVAAMRKTDG
jgi:hypothetical protein